MNKQCGLEICQVLLAQPDKFCPLYLPDVLLIRSLQPQIMVCSYCGNMNPNLFLDSGQGFARCHGVYANGAP